MARPAAPAWARTKAESEAEPCRAKATTEAGPERTVVAGIMTAEMIAELTPGLATLLMQRVLLLRTETEARWLCRTGEGAAERAEWIVHGNLDSRQVTPDALPIRQRYIGTYR